MGVTALGWWACFRLRLQGLTSRLAGKHFGERHRQFTNLLRVRGLSRMRDGRSVELTPVGFKKTRSHSADRRVLDLLPSIRELLVAATPIGSAPPRSKPNSLPSILAHHYYGAWVTLGGVRLYAKLVVRESINRQIFYDTNLFSAKETAATRAALRFQTNRRRHTLSATSAQWAEIAARQAKLRAAVPAALAVMQD